MNKLEKLNNYKGVIIFYIVICILSVLLVLNYNVTSKMNAKDLNSVVIDK